MVRAFILSDVAFYATRVLAAASKQVCGSSPSDSEVAAAEAHFAAQRNKISDDTYRKVLTIPVYWHVIQQSNSTADGQLWTSQIRKSLDVLNKAYKPAGLKFKLEKRDYSTNETWFQHFGTTTSYNAIVKTALHKGTKRSLNVYSTGFAYRTLLGLRGYSTFPWTVADALKLDGVAIKYTTVPKGSEPDYNTGKVLVHEVGHWLGLYHTFQGGCGSSGDQVSDTPDQEVPSSGCSVKQDSCPNQKGFDPSHNYMDYSFDSCRTSLTKGQIKRLRAQIATYRGLQ